MPRHKWYFRVTHRFTRSLGEGDFGDLIGNAFGVDGSAQVGLELRFGLSAERRSRPPDERADNSDLRAAQFLTERNGALIGLDAIATIEGRNNLRDDIQSTLGVIMSRNMFRFAALRGADVRHQLEPVRRGRSAHADVGARHEAPRQGVDVFSR
jgi:hypothetical protein